VDTHESLETRASIGFATGWHQFNRTLLTALLNYVTTLKGFPTLESGESARGPCASRASERAAGAAL
jgi:hypothetical protein